MPIRLRENRDRPAAQGAVRMTETPSNFKAQCSVEFCQQVVMARGYCNRHYQKWSKYGNPLAGGTHRQGSNGCSVEDCTNTRHYALGYCEKHYKRIVAHGDTSVDGRRKVVNGLVRCGRCHLEKPLSDFTRDRSVSLGIAIYCKPCRRLSDMLHKFKLTEQKFAALLASQGNKCAICRDPLLGKGFIDHDHLCCPGKRGCGKCTRGILCCLCNLALGGFRDNTKSLERAMSYLVKWSESHSG